jgi:hypothetical protein
MVIEPPVQHRPSAYGILSVIEIFQPHVLAISLLGGTYTALVPLHEQGESYQWPLTREGRMFQISLMDKKLNSPWRNDSECASEDEVCGNEKWVRSAGQPGGWAAR